MTDLIDLRPDLREILERSATQQSRTLSDVVNEAVGLYVYRMQQAKIDLEAQAYERMHADLRERLPGAWVAIHEQQLVDHGTDLQALYRRVRARYGRTSVLIRQVAANPVDEIWMRTPAYGKRAP